MAGFTAREAWDSYAKGVLPKDAPAVQRTETKRAFMAGLWALLQHFTRVGEPDYPEEQGVADLDALEAELKAFYQRVGRGEE